MTLKKKYVLIFVGDVTEILRNLINSNKLWYKQTWKSFATGEDRNYYYY